VQVALTGLAAMLSGKSNGAATDSRSGSVMSKFFGRK
jgi:hypothetical protein